MAVKASDIVREAMTWVEAQTPFMHQMCIKGVGVDCVNFIAAVSKETGATPDVEFEANYRRHEDGTQLLTELLRYLEPIESVEGMRAADIVAFHDGVDKNTPRHIAFVTQLNPYPKIAHASQHGVKCHRMDVQFRSKIHSIWRRSGLIYD